MTGTAAYLRTKTGRLQRLVTGNAANIISAIQLSKNPPYDPRKDLLPLGYFGEVSYVLTVPKASPFDTFDEFVQYARANPGKSKVGFL